MNRDNYFKTVFKDEEIYHLSYLDLKSGDNWQPQTAWSLNNARAFKIPIAMFPLQGRAEKFYDLYRWAKVNYVSIYVCVSSYAYGGIQDSNVSLDVNKGKVTGMSFL